MIDEALPEPDPLAPPHHPTIRQTLSQLLTETAADAIFLAIPDAHNNGVSFAIVAWYPPPEQRARPITQWIRDALSHTFETRGTLLTVGRWRAATDDPKRSVLLASAPVYNGENTICGVLALVLSSTQAATEVVASLERGAHMVAETLVRPELLSKPSAQFPAHQLDISERNRVLLHELRVPLGAASYALEALIERQAFLQLEHTDKHLIRIAQLGITEAQGIMRSASQLHASAGGRVTPDLRAISLESALTGALDLFPAARDRLRLETHGSVPAVRVDKLWLTEALTNLIENALKYSWPETPVTVSAQSYGLDRVLIAVRSQGGDFPPEQLQLVESDASDAPAFTPVGKGLGLRIVRRFITGMDGSIWVEHEATGALAVMLTLPVAFP